MMFSEHCLHVLLQITSTKTSTHGKRKTTNIDTNDRPTKIARPRIPRLIATSSIAQQVFESRNTTSVVLGFLDGSDYLTVCSVSKHIRIVHLCTPVYWLQEGTRLIAALYPTTDKKAKITWSQKTEKGVATQQLKGWYKRAVLETTRAPPLDLNSPAKLRRYSARLMLVSFVQSELRQKLIAPSLSCEDSF